MDNFKIEVCSVPDRDNLVAELWFNGNMICELNTENTNMEIIFYHDKEGVYNFDDFVKALQRAKEELLR